MQCLEVHVINVIRTAKKFHYVIVWHLDAIACVQTCANQFWKALPTTNRESDSLQDALPSQQRFWRPLRRESASGPLTSPQPATPEAEDDSQEDDDAGQT